MAGLRWQNGWNRHRPKLRTPYPEPKGLRKKRSPWLTCLGMLILISVFASVSALMYVEWRLAPVLEAWGTTRGINIATRVINVAIEETMSASISLSEIAKLVQTEEGRLQAVQYDMGEINRIVSQATHKMQQSLNNLGNEVFPIPLGQLTGLEFLSAWGPGIPVRIIPVGSVTTSPVGSFESAGINQTWHRVYLDVQVTMRILVPLAEKELPVNTRVPIVEEVFIGEVPTWYFAQPQRGVSFEGQEDGIGQENVQRPSPGIVEFRLAQ